MNIEMVPEGRFCCIEGSPEDGFTVLRWPLKTGFTV